MLHNMRFTRQLRIFFLALLVRSEPFWTLRNMIYRELGSVRARSTRCWSTWSVDRKTQVWKCPRMDYCPTAYFRCSAMASKGVAGTTIQRLFPWRSTEFIFLTVTQGVFPRLPKLQTLRVETLCHIFGSRIYISYNYFLIYNEICLTLLHRTT